MSLRESSQKIVGGLTFAETSHFNFANSDGERSEENASNSRRLATRARQSEASLKTGRRHDGGTRRRRRDAGKKARGKIFIFSGNMAETKAATLSQLAKQRARNAAGRPRHATVGGRGADGTERIRRGLGRGRGFLCSLPRITSSYSSSSSFDFFDRHRSRGWKTLLGLGLFTLTDRLFAPRVYRPLCYFFEAGAASLLIRAGGG